MTDTIHLGLPFIEGSQAQKHVTHNEALRILDDVVQIGVLDADRTAPPAAPAEGDRHIVAGGATGAWAGHVNAVAVREDGAWRFFTPKPGWCAWSAADGALLVYDGAAWSGVASGGGGTFSGSVAQLGINDTAAAPNLLTVRSDAALFNAIAPAAGGSGDMRLQISKAGAAGTASVVFSNANSGRAEFGLVGSDVFKLKVSSDGTAFVESLMIDQASGNVTLPRGLSLTGVVSPAQMTANQNDYNPAGLASASVLNLSSDAARSLSGLAGGSEGRVLVLLNVGSQPIILSNESGASTAANRFALGGDLAIGARQSAVVRYDGAASRWYALVRPAGREVLTANRTYYVRTDGSDAHSGLSNTSGEAFLTIQKAIDTAVALDLSVYAVTIQVGAGTYTQPLVLKDYIGAGPITLTGNTATPTSVRIQPASGTPVSVSSVPHKWIVQGFQLTAPASTQCLSIANNSSLDFQNIQFDAVSGGIHMLASGGSVVTATGPYTIAGSAAIHAYTVTGATFNSYNIAITLSGTPAWSSAGWFADRAGIIIASGMTFSGSATGKRYESDMNSILYTNGSGANYFPGSVAGTTSTGGQYS
jgi:hypothetical protein